MSSFHNYSAKQSKGYYFFRSSVIEEQNKDGEVHVSAEAAIQCVLFSINNPHCVYSKPAPKMQAKGDISPQHRLPQPLFTTRSRHYKLFGYATLRLYSSKNLTQAIRQTSPQLMIAFQNTGKRSDSRHHG